MGTDKRNAVFHQENCLRLKDRVWVGKVTLTRENVFRTGLCNGAIDMVLVEKCCLFSEFY